MSIKICFKTHAIGEVRSVGKTLDKAAFLALRNVDRLRAYLLLAWPHARSARVLSKVCQIHPHDMPAYLKGDLREGVIVRTAPGRFQARPVLHAELLPITEDSP
jgi:hypothetical protein